MPSSQKPFIIDQSINQSLSAPARLLYWHFLPSMNATLCLLMVLRCIVSNASSFIPLFRTVNQS
nr:hypothetical protein Q903MT_gene2296 [Picea sitchensis]